MLGIQTEVRRLFYVTILFYLGSVSPLVTVCQTKCKQVVIVSIDGLRPEFYLDQQYEAPNLRAITRAGIYSKGMRSVFPSVTYPSHAAMVTGALPARNGISSNRSFGSQAWHWETNLIKTRTIWDALIDKGMSSAAVQWPISVTNKITWNIPEIWDTLSSADRIKLSRVYSTNGLIEEIEQNVTGPLDSSNFNETDETLDENVGKITNYLFNKYKPNFLAFHLVGLDAAQHEFGLESSETRVALSRIDEIVGGIWKSICKSNLADSTSFIIVGDHGFADFSSILKPNVLFSKLKGRFWGSGGSTFFYPEIGSEKTGVIKAFEEKLATLSNKQRKLFQVLYRDSLDKLGVDSAVLVALTVAPGVILSNSFEGEYLSVGKGGHHGYDPRISAMKTGFIAYGKQFRSGLYDGDLGVVDIAPLIAYLLGLEMNCPDGKLRIGIVK